MDKERKNHLRLVHKVQDPQPDPEFKALFEANDPLTDEEYHQMRERVWTKIKAQYPDAGKVMNPHSRNKPEDTTP